MIKKVNEDPEKENARLKIRLNLLKKYIVQSSVVNKIMQIELFERTQELTEERKKQITEDDEEEII